MQDEMIKQMLCIDSVSKLWNCGIVFSVGTGTIFTAQPQKCHLGSIGNLFFISKPSTMLLPELFLGGT